MTVNYSKLKMINSIVAYQIGWFACAYWHNEFSIFAAFIILAWLAYSERWSAGRLKLTIQIALIGMLVDTTLVYFGLIRFDTNVLLIPIWLVMLWLMFACTCTMSLLWIFKKPVVAAISGAVFGPLSYWAGMQFNALSISESYGLMLMSGAWAMMMWLFSYLYSKSIYSQKLDEQRV